MKPSKQLTFLLGFKSRILADAFFDSSRWIQIRMYFDRADNHPTPKGNFTQYFEKLNEHFDADLETV